MYMFGGQFCLDSSFFFLPLLFVMFFFFFYCQGARECGLAARLSARNLWFQLREKPRVKGQKCF